MRNVSNSVRSKIIKKYLLTCLQEGKLPDCVGITENELRVARNAFIATRNFHNQICSKDATVSSVMNSLTEMRRNTKQFEILYGISWPLLSLCVEDRKNGK